MMTAKTIDGRAVAKRINDQTRQEVAALDFVPGLGVVMVGNNPASHLYVSLKEKACRRLGVKFMRRELPTSATQEDVLAAVNELNANEKVSALIVQLPLPPHLDTNEIIAAIDPHKDADGFHPDNIRVAEASVPPVLPSAVLELIRVTGENLSGKNAVVVAKGEIFYAPMERTLKEAGVEAELVTFDAEDAHDKMRGADILIVAVGYPRLIKKEAVKPGAIVIDIGTTRVGHKTIGDVDAASVDEVAGWLTPVPGGVGPVTVATLIKNVVRLAKASWKEKLC